MLGRALFLKKNRLKKAGREFSNQGKFSLKNRFKTSAGRDKRSKRAADNFPAAHLLL